MLQTIIFAVLGFILLRFAAGVISKLIGCLLIVIGVVIFLYHQGLGPFERNYLSVAELERKYCLEEVEAEKCDCIVQVVKTDLTMRFDEEEISSWERNRLKGAYALQRSLQENEEQIAACLMKRNALSELKEFQRDLLPFDSDIIRWTVNIFDRIGEISDDYLKDIQEEKEEIDEKF